MMERTLWIFGVVWLLLGMGGQALGAPSSKTFDEFRDAMQDRVGIGPALEMVYDSERSGTVYVAGFNPRTLSWYKIYDDYIYGSYGNGGYKSRVDPDDTYMSDRLYFGDFSASTRLDKYFGFVLIPGLFDQPELVREVLYDSETRTWTLEYVAPVGRRDYALGFMPDGITAKDTAIRVEFDTEGRMVSRRYGNLDARRFTFHEDSPDGMPVPLELGGLYTLRTFRVLEESDFSRDRVMRRAVEYDTSGARGKTAPVRRIAVETRDDGRRTPASQGVQTGGGISWWVWVVSLLIVLGVGSGLYLRFRHAG